MHRMTHRGWTRRRLIGTFGAALGGASMLPLFGRARASDDIADRVLRIGTWGGTWRDAVAQFVSPAIEARGTKLEYVLDSPSGNVARLIAARGREAPFDGMESAAEFMPGLIAEKMIEKLDYENIPNAKLVPALAISDYSVTTTAVLDCVVYNSEKFQEAGVAPPTRYSDLANPKLAGRVAFPNVGHSQHTICVVGLAYDAGGDETSLRKAIPLINKINPAVFYSSSTDLAVKFSAGEIWAAPWHAGYAIRLRRDGFPVAVAYQNIADKRGGLTPNVFHIAAGARNLADAEAFLDAYLAPDAQFDFAKATGSVPMNGDARKRLQSDPESKDILLLSDAEIDGTFLIDFSKVDLAAWREAWNREVVR